MATTKTITSEEVNRMYEHSYSSLYTAYNCPSVRKRSIWESIIHNGEGYDYAVRSRNTNFFTVMYKTHDNRHLVVIFPTREERYAII